MTIKIRGTNLYLDTTMDEIRDERGKVLTKSITCDWYGDKVVVDEEWLKNMVKFRIYSDDEYIGRRLIYTRFTKHRRDIDETGTEAYSIYFTKPIPVKDDPNFRVIARYPTYGIDEHGNVLNIKTGKVRNIEDTLEKYTKYTQHNNYPFIYMYDARLGISTKTYIHVLIATTWLKNNNWERYIVNHIDHDKTNLKLSNFEWVTPSENTFKYYDKGRSKN